VDLELQDRQGQGDDDDRTSHHDDSTGRNNDQRADGDDDHNSGSDDHTTAGTYDHDDHNDNPGRAPAAATTGLRRIASHWSPVASAASHQLPDQHPDPGDSLRSQLGSSVLVLGS
jgi:hypothetical protein